MGSPSYSVSAGLGRKFDLRKANASDVRFKVAFLGGMAAFFLAVLILPNPAFLLNTVEGHPRSAADYVVVVAVFSVVGAMLVMLVLSLLAEVSVFLVIQESGLVLERNQKITHSIPWSGGKQRVTLGDARIPQTSDTPDTVVPTRDPPNAAWLQPGLTMLGTTKLTDEAYDASLNGARDRKLPIQTKVVGVATKGGVWYYLQYKIG